MLRSWLQYAAASTEVLHFYFTMIFRFGEIHPELPSGVLLDSIMAVPDVQEVPSKFPLQMKFSTEFNTAYDELKTSLRSRLASTGGGKSSFKFILSASFVIRALWALLIVAVVWHSNHFPLSTALRVTLLGFGLLQFIVAPMSLVVCIMRLGTNIWDCLLHYTVNLLVSFCVLSLTSGSGSGIRVSIGTNFAVLFLTGDFLLNLFVYLRASESFGPRRLLKHILYGSFNTKSYFAVVLSTLWGLEIDLGVWVLASLLTRVAYRTKVFQRFLNSAGLPSFPVMFYVEHRINHCPIIYSHAHKMHHYLHDTTAFDAHIYGSGMNEEFGWILAETLPCIFFPHLFLFPYFLNFETLYASWTNKGGHTRTSNSGAKSWADFDEDNFHADHHTLHRANFGSAYGPLLDFYFNTQGKGTRGVWGKRYTFDPPRDLNSLDQSGGTAYFVVSDLSPGESNRTTFAPL